MAEYIAAAHIAVIATTPAANVLHNDAKLHLGQTYDVRITKENLLDRTVRLTTFVP
jgi:hypothetical protein